VRMEGGEEEDHQPATATSATATASSAATATPPAIPSQDEFDTAFRVVRFLLDNPAEVRNAKYMPFRIACGRLAKPFKKSGREKRMDKKERKRKLRDINREVIEQTEQRRLQKKHRKTFVQQTAMLPPPDVLAEAQGSAAPALAGATLTSPAFLTEAEAPEVTVESREDEAHGQEEEDVNVERAKMEDGSESEFLKRELKIEQKCYTCKKPYTRVHFFYHLMCPECATFNYKKRIQKADLRGRIALVTGARIKIGFQIALVLLRYGALVIITTRFPKDAAQRFAKEKDFNQWKDRLHIYGLDLRQLPVVERFCQHLTASYPHLDIIINNAAQTVRKPTGFYAHLLPTESRPLEALPEPVAATLRPSAPFERTLRSLLPSSSVMSSIPARAAPKDQDDMNSAETAASASTSVISNEGGEREEAHLSCSAAISQVALLEEDSSKDPTLFPMGLYDGDQQQLDLRKANSWTMPLENVSLPEAVEVHAINVLAPFTLNSKLKPLMLKSGRDTYIINVSAMEGQFYRKHKTAHHPHTNMAKAALNMMTRTSAPAYAQEKIYMNSVDTGWINDENPFHIALENEQRGFRAPLDEVDGAMRVLDPILHAVNSGQAVFGAFLKDYRSCPW